MKKIIAWSIMIMVLSLMPLVLAEPQVNVLMMRALEAPGQNYINTIEGQTLHFQATIENPTNVQLQNVPYIFYNSGYPDGTGATKKVSGSVTLPPRQKTIVDITISGFIFRQELQSLASTYNPVLVLDAGKVKTQGALSEKFSVFVWPQKQPTLSQTQPIPVTTEQTMPSGYADCKYKCYMGCGINFPVVTIDPSPPVIITPEQNLCVQGCVQKICQLASTTPAILPDYSPAENCKSEYRMCIQGGGSEEKCTTAMQICHEASQHQSTDDCGINKCIEEACPGKREQLKAGNNDVAQEVDMCITKCQDVVHPCVEQQQKAHCGEQLKKCLQGAEDWGNKCKEGALGGNLVCTKDGTCTRLYTLPNQEEATQPGAAAQVTTLSSEGSEDCLKGISEQKSQCQQWHDACIKGQVFYEPQPLSPDVKSVDLSNDMMCPQGCYVDSDVKKCVPYGTRLTADKIPGYCDIDGMIQKQKNDGVAANNNYECQSNSARYGVCENVAEQVNIMQKIFGWLSRIFK